MKEIEVYFVRHGETMYNLMRKMQGWSDTPLTERGIPVLEATAQKLQNTHFDAVYSSDLKRAVDTAKIMLTANHATDTQIIESRNLREVFFGSFEGENEEETWERVGAPYGIKTIAEFRDHYSPDFLRDATKEADVRHLAENAQEVKVRLQAGLQEIYQASADHSRILIATHGGVIKDLVSKNSPAGSPYHTQFPKNGSVTKTRLTGQNIIIDDYNLLP